MVKFKTDDLLENLRCRVECSEQEVYKAKKLGFSKIVINISLDPFASIHDKLKLTEHVLQTVCSNNQEIYLSIDNALEFPVEEVNIVDILDPFIAEYEIKRLILGDVNGKMDPFTTYNKLNLFTDMAQCPVDTWDAIIMVWLLPIRFQHYGQALSMSQRQLAVLGFQE